MREGSREYDVENLSVMHKDVVLDVEDILKDPTFAHAVETAKENIRKGSKGFASSDEDSAAGAKKLGQSLTDAT